MLLLPLALAPMITVNGPRRSVASVKFLKSTSRNEVITGFSSSYNDRLLVFGIVCKYLLKKAQPSTQS